MTAKKDQSITKVLQEAERYLPALVPADAFYAALLASRGGNAEEGFRSAATRLCQSPATEIRDGQIVIFGGGGTSGATTRFQQLLGTRQSDMSDEDREYRLCSLLVQRSLPNDRMFMASYMLAKLSNSQLEAAIACLFGKDKDGKLSATGKAVISMIKANAKFVFASREVVPEDIKKAPGTMKQQSASKRDHSAHASKAQALLAELLGQ